MTSSNPTAAELIIATSRTERIAITAWTGITATVIHRAVFSSLGRFSSGIRAWLASALSIATTPIASVQTASHPKTQPIFGFANRDAHW